MPDTILLRYHQEFPGGAESLFVAAVPRASGRIRIVPVLYRGATPFFPAPADPRNVALFNQLAPQPFGNSNSLELSDCYAALTGAQYNPDTAATPKVEIAGAPAPTIRLEPRGKLLGVTLATRESADAYTTWDLSLNGAGRVKSVATGSSCVCGQVGCAAQFREERGAGESDCGRYRRSHRRSRSRQSRRPWNQDGSSFRVRPIRRRK